MASYRDPGYGINSKSAYDPIRYPQSMNIDINAQKPLGPESGPGLPIQFGSASARAYAKEFQVSPEVQALNKQQQFQQPTQGAAIIQNIVQPQTIYQEIQHYDKPVQVVPRTDIEEPWRTKCTFLEKQIYDLQQENFRLKAQNIASEKISYFEDTGRVNQLMQEVDRLNKTILDLNSEIDQWRLRYSNLEDQLKMRSVVDMELERMKRAVQDNENIVQIEMNRLRDQLDQWQRRCQSLESQRFEAQDFLSKSRTKDQNICNIMINFVVNLQSDLKKAELNLKLKQDDLDTVQQKLNRFEKIVRETEYQNQEIANLRKIIDDRNKELEILRRSSQSQQANQNLKDLESKVSLFQSECNRLNQLLNHKEQELQLYRDQLKRQSHYSNKQ
ncbi:unnamed protein product (macronuclear) [Paramecium tetraurelia]|uniref:Uncharacterized protein n=1 Tax=Paramecium tetraurelia TaxID=5888 RepID=A0CPB2_PARTE|nr:uncharacterized protein GSPATT00009020001 [Paramecium tetraurelia]CAK72629.1 unnamed protein product [Paramecium tetraurelia]|eukprot:XP_001440026.1 hypothetical protein (macronuclear) [Paramecium tetraurelia strain d4-2]